MDFWMFNFLKKKKPVTLFHVTHWKAGSQWIHKILHYCAHERVIAPQQDMKHFLQDKILPGKIYPTLYLPYQEFTQVELPQNSKYFVVIRDLRDALISFYFSIKISHSLDEKWIAEGRNKLNEIGIKDEALIYLIEEGLYPFADIQHSWYQSGETLIRYEDILENDVEILTPILVDNLAISKEFARIAIEDNRFEVITKGRQRGQEDMNSHERKASPGD